MTATDSELIALHRAQRDARHDLVESLRYKLFPVLDDGHVMLIDVMGDDAAITQAARVSYGAGTKSVSDDRGLIRYLMRSRHTSPFEQAELKFRVRVPMDCWRQWIRHRMSNVNEASTRYSEAIDSAQTTRPHDWRAQAKSNKQGSDGTITEWPDGWRHDAQEDGYHSIGEYLSEREAALQRFTREVYEERLKAGVAREQARKDLPLSTYTEAYWKIDLHNLFHFLGLRMDSHAQLEIRQYATIIGEQIVKPLFPLAWEAFVDYRLKAVTLTAIDQAQLQNLWTAAYMGGQSGLTRPPYPVPFFISHLVEPLQGAKNRERDECLAKLQQLGIVAANE